MNNLNSILLEGNLTRDPQEKSIEGTVLSSFTVASNRYYKKEGEHTREVSYFNVDVWGKTAEYCNQYLKKGSGVRVVGRLKQERWVDSEQNNHSIIKIVAEHVDFFPNKKNFSEDKKEEGKEEIPSKETVAL